MNYFIDNNNQTWAYEDDVPQEVIDLAQSENNIAFRKITEAEFIEQVRPNLDDAKIIKLGEIKSAFNEAEISPVVALDLSWNGGTAAAAKYKIGYDFAEMSGQTTVDFKDTSGTKHTLSLADAKSVLLSISADYITKDTRQDELLELVKQASTVDDVERIKISF